MPAAIAFLTRQRHQILNCSLDSRARPGPRRSKLVQYGHSQQTKPRRATPFYSSPHYGVTAVNGKETRAGLSHLRGSALHVSGCRTASDPRKTCSRRSASSRTNCMPFRCVQLHPDLVRNPLRRQAARSVPRLDCVLEIKSHDDWIVSHRMRDSAFPDFAITRPIRYALGNLRSRPSASSQRAKSASPPEVCGSLEQIVEF